VAQSQPAVFIAGGHRDTPSLQGALVSGRPAPCSANWECPGLACSRADATFG